MKSKKTKNNQLGYIITSVISVILWLAPIAIFLFLSIMNSTFMYQKVALSMTVLAVIVMTIIALTSKVAMRSRLWVMLIGIYICLQNIMTPIIIFACCQVADELIVCPLKERFKRKYQINKEIDGRL